MCVTTCLALLCSPRPGKLHRQLWCRCSGTLTLVVGESALRTLPCQGRVTCSGGPRGPPGVVLRLVPCSSTLKPFVTRHRRHPLFVRSFVRPKSVSPSARQIPHDEGGLKCSLQCHPDSRETWTPHARRAKQLRQVHARPRSMRWVKRQLAVSKSTS